MWVNRSLWQILMQREPVTLFSGLVPLFWSSSFFAVRSLSFSSRIRFKSNVQKYNKYYFNSKTGQKSKKQSSSMCFRMIFNSVKSTESQEVQKGSERHTVIRWRCFNFFHYLVYFRAQQNNLDSCENEMLLLNVYSF